MADNAKKARRRPKVECPECGQKVDCYVGAPRTPKNHWRYVRWTNGVRFHCPGSRKVVA